MKTNQRNQSRLEALKKLGCIVCGGEGHTVHPTTSEDFSDCIIVCHSHDTPENYTDYLMISEDYLNVMEDIS